MSMFDSLKSVFLLLIILQVAPTLVRGIKKQYIRYLEPHTEVGVISFNGLITEAAPYIKDLRSFFKDSDIKALLLKFDCNGSASGTGESIFNEITTLKQEYRKPVIALVENICASGGYHIACSADYIIAPGMALVGSIGVAFPYLFQLDEFMKQHHVGYVPMTAGKYKAATDPFAPMTDDDKVELQKVLDDSYEQFVHNIATSRKLSVADATEWANARIFSGRQAQKLGLIDEVGSISNATRVIKDKALIEGEIDWVHPHKKVTFWNMLMGQESSVQHNGLYNTLWHSFATTAGKLSRAMHA